VERNRIIRAAAQDAGVTLIELGPIFTARCLTKRCPELLFWDNHPNAEGHALAARVLAEYFR
jgi:hypothetical protein